MHIVLRWVILTLSILATAYLVPDIYVSSFATAIIVGGCLAFINLIIKPIITILTLPLNILTLGFFSLIINGLIFWFLASFINGFTVKTFYAAFVGALVVSVLNWLGDKLLN